MAQGKVFETIISMSGEVSPALGKSLEKVQKNLEGVNLKALAAGAAVGGIALATAKAVKDAGKYLANLGNTFNSATNDMAAATGLVGEELAEMSDIMKEVYGNNFGESMEDVAAGLSEVYRTTGLVGEELQAATEAGFALSDTFGYEMSESAKAASALMKNFGVTAEEAYNLMAVGAQNGADQNGDMIDALNEYSAQYAALGLDADQFMASLISGNEAGVFSIDKVGDAVKEFNIRSKDMSKTSAEAFKSLGFNANDMFARFAAGGDEAEAAMFEVINALQNTDDATVKNAAAVGLFGTMYEDLESNLLPVLQTMEGATLRNVDALQEINEVKYDNLGKAFEGIKRQAEVALLPLASSIANALTDIAPMIGQMFEQLAPIITTVTSEMMPFVEEFLYGAMDAIKMLVPLVLQLAKALLPILGNLVKTLLPVILDLIEQILPPLLEIVNAVLPPIMSILTAVLPILTQIILALLPPLLAIINAILPVLMPVIDILLMLLNAIVLPLLPLLTEIIMAILPIFVTLIEMLMPILTPIIDIFVMLLNEILAALMPLLMSITNAIMPILLMSLELLMPALEPVFAVLGFIGDVLGVVVGFIGKIVGWVAKGLTWVVDLIFGDSTSDIAKTAELEGYAAGGFTNGISIAGEAGTEAVISFDPAYRSQNLSYWAKAGRMLGADASDYNFGSYSSPSVDVGGITFAPNINVNGNASKQDIIAAIEETYPEFVDLVDRILNERGVGVYA